MNELIEKLKKNEKPFGLMSQEEQECLISVGKINCMWYSMHKWQDASDTSGFFDDFTYAIKPDYQPEPKFVDLEIDCDVEINTGRRWLGVHRDEKSMFLPYLFTHLHCLPSLPSFVEFNTKDNDILLTEHVATCIREGRTVYARFGRV